MPGAEMDSSGHLGDSSGHSTDTTGHSERDRYGCLVVDGLDKPLIDNLKVLNSELGQELVITAIEAEEKRRLPAAVMAEIILFLCRDYYLTLPVLCKLLNRQPDPLRKQYLKPLVEKSQLSMAFPATPTHPQQAYTTTDEQ